MYTNLEEKTQTCRSSIDTPSHKPKRKLARVQVWPTPSVAWPTTTRSMVLKGQMMVQKGSKRYIGTGCLFPTFFAPPKSFLCRLDQTKSLQSIPTLQQTFLPRFQTLPTQIALKKFKQLSQVKKKGCTPVPMYANLEEKTQTCRSSIDTPSHEPK